MVFMKSPLTPVNRRRRLVAVADLPLHEEFGLTGPEAVAAASQPPSDISRQHDQADGQPDREAAD